MMKKLALIICLISGPAFGQIVTPGTSGFQHIYATGTSVGNGADTTEDTLQTFTLPAAQLTNIGDVIHIRAGGTLAATTDNRTVRVRFGGQVVGGFSISVASATVWWVDVTVIKTGANTQSFVATGDYGAGNQAKSGTLTVTDTASIVLSVTGQNSTTPTAGSITCQVATIDYEH